MITAMPFRMAHLSTSFNAASNFSARAQIISKMLFLRTGGTPKFKQRHPAPWPTAIHAPPEVCQMSCKSHVPVPWTRGLHSNMLLTRLIYCIMWTTSFGIPSRLETGRVPRTDPASYPNRPIARVLQSCYRGVGGRIQRIMSVGFGRLFEWFIDVFRCLCVIGVCLCTNLREGVFTCVSRGSVHII